MKLLDPLSKLSGEPVQGYSLTKEELRHLAVHWAAVHLDTQVSSFLLEQIGSTELRILKDAAERVTLIHGIIGDAEMEAVFDEADELIRKKVGDANWADFLKGRSGSEE